MNLKKITILLIILITLSIKSVNAYVIERVDNLNNINYTAGGIPVGFESNYNLSDYNNNISFVFENGMGSSFYTAISGNNLQLKIRSGKGKNNYTYQNIGYFIFRKMAYYYNFRGDKIYLDIKIHLDSLYTPTALDADGLVANYVPQSGLWLETASKKVKHKVTFSFIANKANPNVKLPSNLYFQWSLYDLDVYDSTSGHTYNEAVQFNSGFYNKYYVTKNTILQISGNANSPKFTTVSGLDTSDNTSQRRAVYAIQTSNNANIEWWGNGCGTNIFPKLYTVDIGSMKNVCYCRSYPITINARDELSGVDHMNITVDNYPITTKNEKYTFHLSDNGEHTMIIEAFDKAGNSRKISKKITISCDGTVKMVDY